MEPLTAPAEDKWGVCEFLALPFNSVDEAIGVRRTVSGDIEADLDEILLCRWKLLDDPHQADPRGGHSSGLQALREFFSLHRQNPSALPARSPISSRSQPGTLSCAHPARGLAHREPAGLR